MPDDLIDFAMLVRNHRNAKFISKSEAARRIGITPQYYANVEDGKIPSEDVIMRMVEVLELDEYQAFKLADKLPPHILEQAKQAYFNRR